MVKHARVMNVSGKMQFRSQSPCVFWSAPCFLALLTFIETDRPEFSPMQVAGYNST